MEVVVASKKMKCCVPYFIIRFGANPNRFFLGALAPGRHRPSLSTSAYLSPEDIS
jgi:hypothetical protein